MPDITKGGTAITDIRWGTTQAKAVMFRGTQVWPAGTLWLHRIDDQSYFPTTIFPTGWANDVVPNLSAFPAPAKGSVLLNCVLDAYDRIVANCLIFDGTAWTTDPLEEALAFVIDSRAAAGEYIYLHWWNMPGATDVQDFFDAADSGHLRVAVWAAADGIHYKLQNKDNASVEFSKPYPAGITAADLPPTQTDMTGP
jgi:hypothetical protein